MATLIKGGLLVALIVLGTTHANIAQALYLMSQADQLESEAKALYLSVYSGSQAPRSMARLWRARLSGTGAENESTVLSLIDRLSTTVTQRGISVQNLNFNAARGDLSMLTGRTSDQIMRLSESLGARSSVEIGTISQEGDGVRQLFASKGFAMSIQSTMAPLKERFDALQSSEQRAVTILGVFAVVVVIYLGVWAPASDWRVIAEQERDSQFETLSMMKERKVKRGPLLRETHRDGRGIASVHRFILSPRAGHQS